MIRRRFEHARIYGWLGLRLTIADHGTRKALGLIAAASALICLTVSGALGAQALLKQDREIQTWRQVVGDRSQSNDSGVWLTSGTTYPTGSGAELTVLTIASQRPEARLGWPGLSVFPRPGTVMVSEELSDVEGDIRAAIEQYVSLPPASDGGHTELNDQFLRSSDELLAIRFVSTGNVASSPDWKPLQPGTIREKAQTPNVIVVALLLVFFASATLLMTVSARFLHHNQANLAAIRLQGVGRSGVAAISLVPIVVAATGGALAGAALHAYVTAFASDLFPRQIGFVLNRAAISMPSAVVAVLGVVAVVAVMGLVSVVLSRRSLSDVRGDERAQRLPLWRTSLLVPAGVLLAVDPASSRGAVLWWVGVGLFLVGVLALGRLTIASLSRRSWTDPPRLLGFGILRGASRETKLLFTPTVAVLFACALLVPLSSGLEYEDELSQIAQADLIVTDPSGGLGQLAQVQAELMDTVAAWDVGLVANLSTEVVNSDSSTNVVGRHSVWVGGCADLAQFFGDDTLPCQRGVAYFPDNLKPADSSRFAPKDAWRTHGGSPNLIYWANPGWPDTIGDEIALAWLAISLNGTTSSEGVASIARRFPTLHVKVPDEHRTTQRESGQSMRALVLAAIAVVALAALMTFTAAAMNYLARRTVYLEHILRLGLSKGALLTSALIAIIVPVAIGGVLVLPAGLAIGSSFADGSTPTRYILLAVATLFSAVAVGAIVTTLRIVGLQVRAPQRSLGGAGVATRG